MLSSPRQACGTRARMDAQDIERISAWVVSAGLAGDSEIALLHGFCDRCCDAGLPLSRGVAIIDTLHPVYEGRAFFWAGDKAVESPVSEYGPSTDGRFGTISGSAARSTICCNGSDNELRRRLETGEPTGFDSHRRAAGRRADRLHRHGAAVRPGGSHRRDGLLPVALADHAPRRLQRCRPRSASPAGPCCSAWRSSRRRWRASRHRWSKPISAATLAAACWPAACRAAPSKRSMPCCGSRISATTRRCPRTWPLTS